MNTVEKFKTILQQKEMTTDVALELFDNLEAVNLAFVMGRWKGSSFHTNHRMDGLLETIGWYGKDFISPNCAHPLLFSDGYTIFKIDPNPVVVNWGISMPLPKSNLFKPLYSAMSKMLKIEKSKARLRMMEYRGKLSATMIYDYLPINDVLRKVDENTLLGLMDFKGIEQPFFFILSRV